MHKKWSPRWVNRLFVGLIAIGYVVFVGWNILNNQNFWEASATNCVTILIAVIISYYLVQKRNDRRKQKDIILDLLLSMQSQIDAETMYIFNKQGREEILMRNRGIANRIHILEQVKDEHCIKSEVDFIAEKFDEYRTVIDCNIEKLEQTQLTTELKRPLELISSKILEVALKLYN